MEFETYISILEMWCICRMSQRLRQSGSVCVCHRPVLSVYIISLSYRLLLNSLLFFLTVTHVQWCALRFDFSQLKSTMRYFGQLVYSAEWITVNQGMEFDLDVYKQTVR